MTDRKKRNAIIGSLCAIVLLMAIGYAAFSTALNINGTSNITSNWNVKISGVTIKNINGTASNNGNPTFTDTSVFFKTNLESPGDSLEYEVTIKNSGNLNAKVDKITLSDTNNPAIKFTSSGIAKGDVISAGYTDTLLVKVEYLNTVMEQPASTTSNLVLTLDYSQAESGSGGGSLTIEDLKAFSVTSGDGLYTDTYENGRYLYKGEKPNNYITFNDEQYRIVSIESDNTLKIIRDEKLEGMVPLDVGYKSVITNGTYSKGENTITNTRYSASSGAYCYRVVNDYGGCNLWGNSKDTYDSNFSQANQIDVNGTLYNLPDKSSYLNSYLNDGIYLGFTLNMPYYEKITKNKENIQKHWFKVGQVNITEANLDLSISQEQSYNWYGNVGLLNPSDFIRSSMNNNCNSYKYFWDTEGCKLNNYLYKPDYGWWLMSMSKKNSASGTFVYEGGSLGSANGTNYSSSLYGVRPTLFLKSSITLSGDGTISVPYTIE